MGPRKKIAILSIFPIHLLRQFGSRFNPEGHYATWLPQIAEAWSCQKDFEMIWLTGSDLVCEPMMIRELNQTFLVYPIAKQGRAASFYQRQRQEIQKILQNIQPDLVHAWGTEDACGFAGTQSGYPCLLSLQGIHTQLIRHGLHHPRVYFQAALEAYCLTQVGWVTVESEWGRKKIEAFRRNRPIELVEYGVHPRFFEVRWNPSPQPPTFLFVGTVCSQKGIQDCVTAFRDPRLASVRLEVYGSGRPRYCERLQAISSPNVVWKGRQPPELLLSAYQKASGLILPTRADTSPNVVKEARVVGLPVITSCQGGQTEYVVDGEDGYIVPCGDTTQLTKKLMELATNPGLVKRMGELGQSRYREALRPERTAQSFLSLYQKITNTREAISRQTATHS